MERAHKWSIRELRLDHWRIKFHYTDKLPAWQTDEDVSGFTRYSPRERWAVVYVCPERCEQAKHDPIETLFHEMAHVRLAELGVADQDNIPVDRVCDDFAAVMRKAYT